VPKSPGAKSYKTVLDANIWYSAIVYGGKPEEAVMVCLESAEIIMSETLIREIIARLHTKTDAPRRWLKAIEANLRKSCSFVELDGLPDIARDKKDNHVLAAALMGHCKYIVTGDSDLLELENYEGAVILKAQDFINLKSSN
jgi:putative PIN family toxin of toxin-antitoxin system